MPVFRLPVSTVRHNPHVPPPPTASSQPPINEYAALFKTAWDGGAQFWGHLVAAGAALGTSVLVVTFSFSPFVWLKRS